MEPGNELPQLTVTPGPYTTVVYAGASGDFNPIHIDEDFARAVGLPGRILHGLWTMAQVARAQTEAAGGPEKLARLAVQFRQPGVMGEEITITSTVSAVHDDVIVVETQAVQGGKAIIRNAQADLRA